jgi:transposase
MENKQLVSFDNAPTHRSVLFKDFLAKNNVTALEYPPHSPDLAAADCCLFPRLKLTLMGRRGAFVMLLT